MLTHRKRPPWSLVPGVLACALTLLLPLTALADKGNPLARPGKASEPRYEVVVDRDVSIPMRDGVVLKADIYRPQAKGTFPVLVEGTPYGKQTASELTLKSDSFFVPRGYVLVVYDCRGMFASEGDFTPHLTEQNDNYDVIEWAAKQPWSSGKIASIGISYVGQVVLNAAIAQPPHLVCGIPSLTAQDLWREWYYRGGAMELGFLAAWPVWWVPSWADRYLTGAEHEAAMDNAALYWADPESFVDILPVKNLEIGRIGDKMNLFAEWAAHPADGPYWWERNPETYIREINIPLLNVAGWYDIFQNGNIETFNALRHKAASARARDNQRLMIGPWAHFDGGFFQNIQGSVDYGPGLTTPSYNEVRLDFLDYWLKDVQHGTMMDLDHPVWIFVQGDNTWRAEAQWPPARTEYTKFYLNGGKSGSIASLNDGTLSTRLPASKEKPQTYVYDPMNATPTRGGSLLFSFQYGPDGMPGSEGTGQAQQEQTPVDRQSLTFTSEPLDQEMEITGKVRAVLYAASDCVDTDWVVRVCDVAPDGTSLNVVDGIQRARFRTSGINPTLIEPGKVYEYEVDLWSNSYVFQPGHRVRVTVNSSSFPRWSRNMNVAEFPEQATEYKVAHNTIYLDPEHPSHVILPVIPR